MRKLCVALFGVLVVTSCQNDANEPLRDDLDAARARAAAAEQEARRFRREAASAEDDLDLLRDQLAQLRRGERAGQGVVVVVPQVGTLSCDCNDDREFGFTFAPESSTITVRHSVGGVVTRRRLDPGEELRGPFAEPSVDQEWVATYRHKPGTITARISADPGVHQGACFVRHSSLEQSRATN